MDKIETAYRTVIDSLFKDQLPESEQEVFIVNGAPGSGKTTYVQKHRSAGDLILDMDMLVSALLGETLTTHPSYQTVMDIALEARELIYNAIEKRSGSWEKAFVITSSPDKISVQKLAERLSGHVITLDTTKEECIRRIKADPSRNLDKDISLVEHWFKRRKTTM